MDFFKKIASKFLKKPVQNIDPSHVGKKRSPPRSLFSKFFKFNSGPIKKVPLDEAYKILNYEMGKIITREELDRVYL